MIPLILVFVIGQAYENMIGKNVNENMSISLPHIKTSKKKTGKSFCYQYLILM